MRDQAEQILVARLVEDHVKARGKGARVSLLADMAAAGAERVRVTGPDGTDYGTVSTTSGRLSAKVVDPKALAAWVVERYPDRMVTVPDPDFVDRLLHAAKARDIAVDPETGEPVPGIEVTRGDPGISTRPTTAARDRMADLLTDSTWLRLTGGV